MKAREFQLATAKYERKKERICTLVTDIIKNRGMKTTYTTAQDIKYRIYNLKICEKSHSQTLSLYWSRDWLHHEDRIQD
jgi:hypothetical protein